MDAQIRGSGVYVGHPLGTAATPLQPAVAICRGQVLKRAGLCVCVCGGVINCLFSTSQNLYWQPHCMEAKFLGLKLSISILQLFAGVQFTCLDCGDGHSVCLPRL